MSQIRHTLSAFKICDTPKYWGTTNMHITLAQLLVGFKAPMTVHELADSLEVAADDVRARIRGLTPAEEAEINAAMEGH